MRTIFLNVACILTLFDIEAPTGEKLEAEFNEEHVLRYVTVCFPTPGRLLASPVLTNLVFEGRPPRSSAG